MFTTLISMIAILGSAQDAVSPALNGLDPVRLCEGSEVAGRDLYRVNHGRYVYRFEAEDTRRRFQADPERFAIQWGGGCARMGPLSGVGSPERWAVRDGRIFIFASEGCREGFLRNPDRFLSNPPAPGASTPESLEAGSAWIERAVSAHGGAGAVDGLGAVRLVLEDVESGWKRRLEHRLVRGGGFVRHDVWSPEDPEASGFETRWVVGDGVELYEDEHRIEVTSPDQMADLRRLAQREPIALLWARSEEGFVASHEGQEELEGRRVECVTVTWDGIRTRLLLSVESGEILGMAWRGRATDGALRSVKETFSGWSLANGVRVPIRRTVIVDGEPAPSIAYHWDSVSSD